MIKSYLPRTHSSLDVNLLLFIKVLPAVVLVAVQHNLSQSVHPGDLLKFKQLMKFAKNKTIYGPGFQSPLK